MSSVVATDLCRVMLVAPTSSAEIAIPAGVAVGDLLPALVHHSGAAEEGTPEYEQGWVLQRLGEAPLDEEGTPASLGIREGETLYLRPASTRLPASHFDDLIDGIATGIGERKDRWGAETTRWVLRGLCVSVLAFGLWLSWSGPLLARGLVTGLVTLLLLLGSAASSRALADRPTALLLAFAAVPYAGVTGLVVPMGPGSPALAAPSVLCAAIAMALVALLGMVAVGTDEVLFATIAVASGGGVVGGALGVLAGLSGERAAAVLLGLALVFSVFAPTTAFRMARLQLPMLPTGAEDLGKDIEPLPGPELLARAAVADRYLTGMFAAAGLICLGCVTVLAASEGWLPVSTGVTAAAIMLLRSRGLVSTWQRLSALIPAGYAIAVVLAGTALRAGWITRLGMILVPLLGGAIAAVVFSRILPGRRIHPLWGRVGDIAEWIAAIAMIPLILGVLGVFSWARAIAG